MSTHNICFRGEIRKIFTGYPPLSGPMVFLLAFIPLKGLFSYLAILHTAHILLYIQSYSGPQDSDPLRILIYHSRFFKIFLLLSLFAFFKYSYVKTTPDV